MADTPSALRMRAQQIRSACNTFGNFLAGTTDSCSAAADALEELAAKIEAQPASATLQRAAAKVLEQIGDGSDIAAGSNLSDLAASIAASAKGTGIGLGAVAGVGVLVFLALKLLR